MYNMKEHQLDRNWKVSFRDGSRRLHVLARTAQMNWMKRKHNMQLAHEQIGTAN